MGGRDNKERAFGAMDVVIADPEGLRQPRGRIMMRPCKYRDAGPSHRTPGYVDGHRKFVFDRDGEERRRVDLEIG